MGFDHGTEAWWHHQASADLQNQLNQLNNSKIPLLSYSKHPLQMHHPGISAMQSERELDDLRMALENADAIDS